MPLKYEEKTMKTQSKDLTKGPLLSGIIAYTIPIILTGILQLLFNAADLMVVGNFCGGISVGAVGATGSLTNLFVNLFLGLSVGVGVSVAHAIGEEDDEEVHRLIHTSVPLSIIVGLTVTVLGLLFSEKFLMFMGTPENVLPLSALYMRVYFCGMIFNMLYNFCASILRAAGDTKSPLYFLMIAGVVNVILNIVFVTVFHMDVAGVALATSISQAISAILVIITLLKRKDSCRLIPSKMRFYGYEISKILRIGVPAGIQSSVFAISNVIIQSSINSFGDTFIAGSAAATSVEGFVYTAQNAFHQTTVNYVGQNTGARNFERVKKTLYICMGMVTAVGFSLALIIYIFGEPLLKLFVKDSAQAINDGMIKLAYVCVPYFLCGLMEVTSGALRGIGRSFTSMVITIIGVCGIRIMWIFTVFAEHHTPQMLLISYPISWIITTAVQFFVFLKIFKRVSLDEEPILR